jgi:hypothetical protein
MRKFNADELMLRAFGEFPKSNYVVGLVDDNFYVYEVENGENAEQIAKQENLVDWFQFSGVAFIRLFYNVHADAHKFGKFELGELLIGFLDDFAKAIRDQTVQKSKGTILTN